MIAALLLQVATAVAPPPADQPPTVVVTGRPRDQAKAVRRMTARSSAVVDVSESLPRLSGPICPEAVGLPKPYADRFAARMRRQIVAAGLDADRPGCAANISVAFVPNGRDLVRDLRKKKPQMLGNLDPSQVRRLIADTGPVHLWSFTEARGPDDDQASMMRATTWLVVGGVIMLIDQDAAIGKTLDQLADYAVMRTVAMARPIGKPSAEPTILELFNAQAEPPKEMSRYDLAYLRALYRGDGTDPFLSKIRRMAHDINKSLMEAIADKDAAAK